MGEAKRRSNFAVRDAVEALGVDTVGGRVQVHWNTHRAARHEHRRRSKMVDEDGC